MIKPIANYTGYYISDDGRVYCNLSTSRKQKSEMHEIKPRVLNSGYVRVCMRHDKSGKRKDELIHRLVALNFIENSTPQERKYINHKNCNRKDNRAENLEWCTAKENMEYSMKLGHLKRDKLGRFVGNYNYM